MENDVVKLHIEAHLMNYMRKQGLQGKSKLLERQPKMEIEMPEIQQPEEVEEELTQEIPQEGIQSIVSRLMPQTTEEVK
jgi:hypothetical protein